MEIDAPVVINVPVAARFAVFSFAGAGYYFFEYRRAKEGTGIFGRRFSCLVSGVSFVIFGFFMICLLIVGLLNRT